LFQLRQGGKIVQFAGSKEPPVVTITMEEGLFKLHAGLVAASSNVFMPFSGGDGKLFYAPIQICRR
jgi:hypothetical protein